MTNEKRHKTLCITDFFGTDNNVIVGGYCQTSLSEPLLIYSEEPESSRNQNTIVTVKHFEQSVLDVNGKPTGDVVTSERRIVTKGDGLCYDARDYSLNPSAAPLWQPSVPEFTSVPGASGIAFEAVRGALRVRMGEKINSYRPITCLMKNREKDYQVQSFTDTAGDPGFAQHEDGWYGWDLNGNGDHVYVDSITGEEYRDPGDLVPTIIIKKVDP